MVKRYTERRDRAEIQLATLTCIFANVHRDSKARPKPYTIYDWLPDGGGEEGRKLRSGDGQWTLEDILTPVKSGKQIRDHLRGVQLLYGTKEKAMMARLGGAVETDGSVVQSVEALSIAEKRKIRQMMQGSGSSQSD